MSEIATETVQFLVYRYSVIGLTLIALFVAIRFDSRKAALALPAGLSALMWLYSYLPLVQPYGLRPETTTSFDLALLSHGAVRGEITEGWLTDTRNPRPLWSALGALASAGSPARSRQIMEFLPLVLLIVFPLVIFWLLRTGLSLEPWPALGGAFAGALAPAVSLDSFAPYGLFHQEMFFVSPRRALALVIGLAALGLLWGKPNALRIAGGILLGALSWLDGQLFVWTMISSFLGFILGARKMSLRHTEWIAMVVSVAMAAPAVALWFSNDLLVRAPPSSEVEAFRLAFVDVLGVTVQHGLLFFFAVAGALYGFRQPSALVARATALMAASYLVWVGSALAYHVRPFSESETSFHLVRFSIALLAGIGIASLGRDVLSAIRRRYSQPRDSARLPVWSFALVVIVLLPTSAPFLWRPLMVDPMYYPSTYEWDHSLVRLERFLVEHAEANDVVLTGDDTGEWIAALTGRRAYKVDSVLDRAEARARRRVLRQLFLSGEPELMRNAMDTAGAAWLVIDPSLREIYWEFDEESLEASGHFEKVHQIGDRYSVYRLTPEPMESRRRDPNRTPSCAKTRHC